MTLRIDWTHPLTRGLRFCAPLNGSTEALVPVITNPELGLSLFSPQPNFSFTQTKMGQAAYFGNVRKHTGDADDWINYGLFDMSNWQAMTASVLFFCDGSTGSEHTIFGNYDGSGASFDMSYDPGTNGPETTITLTSGAALNNHSVQWTAAPNEWHHWIMRYDPNGDGQINNWLNGIKQAGATNYTNPLHGTASISEFRIGGTENNNFNWDGFRGNILAPCVWDRPLSEGEIQQLFENPYQIFEKESVYVPFNVEPTVEEPAVDDTELVGIHEVPWTKQPPQQTDIDRTNEFGRHVIVCANCNGDNMIDRAYGLQPSNKTSSLGRGLYHARGQEFSGAAQGDRITYTKNNFLDSSTAQGVTILGIVQPNWTNSDNFAGIVGFFRSNTDPAVNIIQNNGGGAGWMDYGGGNIQGIPIPDDEWSIVIGSVTESTDVYFRTYFTDGTLRGSGSATGASSEELAQFSLGWRGGEEMDGPIALGVGFNTGFNPSQMDRLAKNPWQIFEPKKLPVFREKPTRRLLTVPKTVPWTKQPPPGTEIDTTNPITKDMMVAYVPWNLGWGDAGPNKVGLEGIYGDVSLTGGRKMMAARVNAGTDTSTRIDLNAPLVHSNDVSQFGLIRYNNNAGDICSYGVPNNDPELMIGINGTPAIYILNNNIATGATTIPVNEWITVGASKTSGSKRMYLNGIDDGGNTTTANKSISVVTIGNNFGGGSSADTDWALFVQWGRVLTPTEFKSMHDNPWQIFEPQTISVPYDYVQVETTSEEEEERLFIFERQS